MDTTQVLQAVGGDGLFQVCLIVVTEYIRLTGFWSSFFFRFGNYQPPWRCLEWKENFSLERGQEQDGGWNTSSEFISPNDPHSCDIYEACSKIEFEPGSSTLVTEWELMCDKQWIATLLVTAQIFGNLCGVMLGGQLAERFGRKFTVYLSTCFHGIFVFFSVFVSNWELFFVLRTLVGLCYGTMFSTCGVYSMEFMGPAGLSALKISPVMGFAASSFCLAVYFDRSWKSLSLITLGLILLASMSCLVMPESMRWLYVKGKLDKYESVARKISRWNRQDSCPPIDFAKFAEEPKSKTTYLDLYRTRQIAMLTFSMSYLWFTCIFVYFMLGLGTKSMSGDFYTNTLLFSLFEVPVFILIAPAVRWTGNRKSLIILTSISCMCMLTSVVISNAVADESKGLVMITYFGIIAKLSVSGSNQIMGVYIGELFPTTLRSLSAGHTRVGCTLGMIAASCLVPSRSVAISAGFPVAAALLLLSCVTLCFLPETKNKSMEDFKTADSCTETSPIVSSEMK